MDPIITIGREYGSGGREIGKLVADKLGIASLSASWWPINWRFPSMIKKS